MANVRVKFRVASAGSNSVRLDAMMSDEVEERLRRCTPCGALTMSITIDNPQALEFFTQGKTVYLDFSEAP